jgi:hypothetical protein
MSRIPIITYEYVPPDGDTGRPIRIFGLQEYSPGNHSGRVDAYMFKVPEGVLSHLPPEYQIHSDHEVSSFTSVIRTLVSLFEGETEESVRNRLTVKSKDKVQFRD